MATRASDPLLALLRCAAAGDDAALEDLLARLHRVVIRFLNRRFGHDPEVEALIDDAAVETLVRIAGAVNSCRANTDTQLLAWTLAVARNATIDLVRQEMVHAASTLVHSPLEADCAEAPEIKMLRPSPAEDALMRLVQEIHDSLPDDLQLLLWLRLVEGASWAEVAKEVGTTLDAAKRRFQRGQQRLQREVARHIQGLTLSRRALVLERLEALGIDLERDTH